jgi:glycosyltransferase involved in cell wall biosynthesis
VADGPLRILLACPAYWPARAFGGPVVVARELVRRLVERGHSVDVVTTTLVDLHSPPSRRTTVAVVDGARVHYLGTPLHYRWMGIPPTLPWWLAQLPRPDVVHVYGFRDPVTTGAAAWCRVRHVPYVFEPLGMLRARLRKVGLKRVLDNTVYRGVASGAARIVAVSALEAEDAADAGIERDRIVVRGNGFPSPDSMPAASGRLRRELSIPDDAAVVLYVGRIASGKGIEHVLGAARRLANVHLVLVGPDDRQGTMQLLRAAQAAEETAGRVHVLPPDPDQPLWLYAEADVLVLASTGESFGMVVAEAAAAGTPVVITDRVGVKDFFRDGEAIVVPDRREAVVEAIEAVIGDRELRTSLGAGGRAAAQRMSWEHVTDLQEGIYRVAAASRIAATKLSSDES